MGGGGTVWRVYKNRKKKGYLDIIKLVVSGLLVLFCALLFGVF